MLLQLYEASPEVVAARLSAEIAAARLKHLAAQKQAAEAVSVGYDWSRLAAGPRRAEVLRRRAQPKYPGDVA
jgi:hypothetical protein